MATIMVHIKKYKGKHFDKKKYIFSISNIDLATQYDITSFYFDKFRLASYQLPVDPHYAGNAQKFTI